MLSYSCRTNARIQPHNSRRPIEACRLCNLVYGRHNRRSPRCLCLWSLDVQPTLSGSTIFHCTNAQARPYKPVDCRSLSTVQSRSWTPLPTWLFLSLSFDFMVSWYVANSLGEFLGVGAWSGHHPRLDTLFGKEVIA